MKDYIASYDVATRRVLENAARIDRFVLPQIDAQYSLYDIATVLREKYKDHLFEINMLATCSFKALPHIPRDFVH